MTSHESDHLPTNPHGDASDSSQEPSGDRGTNVWVVIPAYRERGRLARTLATFEDYPYHVVVIDDGSPDQTFEDAREAGVWSIRHPINCGQGAALQTGIRFAVNQGAEIIVTFDADGQHLVEEIEQLIEPVRSGQADVALGSRFLGKAVDVPLARKLLLKAAVVFTRIVSQVKITDTHNGLRAMTREAAEKIQITQNRMAHASEIYDEIKQNGLKYTEVPVTILYDPELLAKGQSGWNAVRISSEFLLSRVVK